MATTPGPQEATFRAFTQKQAESYATLRRDYHRDLYALITSHHGDTGGRFDTLLDVGCGPGTAARALAPHFRHVVALDPSEGMIAKARELGGSAGGGGEGGGEAIQFGVSTAEELAHPSLPGPASTEGGTVDLITAATAAHWFDMPRFWRRASVLLRPGGTVAFWSNGSMRPAPDMPFAERMQAAADQLEEELDPFVTQGNRITRDLYRSLVMPWDDGVDEGGEEDLGFDKAALRRVEWGTTWDGGEVRPMDQFAAPTSQAGGQGGGGGGQGKSDGKITVEMMEMMMGTGSPVIRWREAHPDLVGTEQDVVRKFRRAVEKCLIDGGLGLDEVKGGLTGVMILVKKNNREEVSK